MNSAGDPIKICHILPAAGEATRWNRAVQKELLPVDNKTVGLTRNLIAGWKGGASTAVIVTTPLKIGSHIYSVLNHPICTALDVYYTMQQRDGLWGAWVSALSFNADYYFFSMPDTYFDLDVFTKMNPEDDLIFGVFNTWESERYGILDYHGTVPVTDKAMVGADGEDAWGVIGFSKHVRDFWLDWEPYGDYTEALNHAALKFGYDTVRLDLYRDFANYDEYTDAIEEGTI